MENIFSLMRGSFLERAENSYPGAFGEKWKIVSTC
jgi:hypothetical protein